MVTMSANSAPLTLRALLGDYPNALALKRGEIGSSIVRFDFADVRTPSHAFKDVVRHQKFDVAELAIVTYLQAKAHGKPLVLLPAVVVGHLFHPLLAYNAERGHLSPTDLAGRRIGIRAYSVTTVTWLRGILQNDYGVDLDSVRWVTFEDAHVAEYHDPDTAERAPAGKQLLAMLLNGELDAAVVGGADLKDSRLQPVIANPTAASLEWCRRHQATPINHMVVVKESLSKSNPEAVREIFRLLRASKQAAPPAANGIDTLQFGVEANRRSLELIIDYSAQQRLIPRKFAVDELFDDVTRVLDG
jgi:4,5-dihydroxyphthalate decarboxylase